MKKIILFNVIFIIAFIGLGLLILLPEGNTLKGIGAMITGLYVGAGGILVYEKLKENFLND